MRRGFVLQAGVLLTIEFEPGLLSLSYHVRVFHSDLDCYGLGITTEIPWIMAVYASFVVFQLFSRNHVFARFFSDHVEETFSYQSQQGSNEITAEKGEKLDGSQVERAPVSVVDVEAAEKLREGEKEAPRSSIIFDIILMVLCIGVGF